MEITIITVIANALVTIILGLYIKNYLPTYFSEKGKNLATKEDIAEITTHVKRVENQFLEQAELSKTEREFYNDMIEVIYRFLSQIKKYEYENKQLLTKNIVKEDSNKTKEYHEFIDSSNRILGKAFVFLKEDNYILLRDAIKTELSFSELADTLRVAMRKSIYKDTKLTKGDLRELKY